RAAGTPTAPDGPIPQCELPRIRRATELGGQLMMSGIVNVSDCAFPLLYFLLCRLPLAVSVSACACSKCQRVTPRPCGLMARKTNDDSHEISERAREAGSDLRLYVGAGDGNRPRTISLGICTVRACRTA